MGEPKEEKQANIWIFHQFVIDHGEKGMSALIEELIPVSVCDISRSWTIHS